MRIVMSVLVTVVVAYLGLCAWVYATQRSQIYFPTPGVQHPAAVAIWLEHAGEQLKVWAVQRPGRRALIYFGGNAEDVGGNISEFSAAFPDRSLYLVNYRGYGGSTGQPSEAALFADALAVYDHVRRQSPDVAVMGRSLGGGVAVWLAKERPVDRLVLVTAFDSLANVARAHFRWLPVGLLMRDRFDSASRAPAVTAPVLIIIAGEDEIVPRHCSEALAGAFGPTRARVEVIPDVGHNTLDLSPEYLRSVRAFLAEQ